MHLTRRELEYLKALAELTEKNSRARLKDIANRLGVEPPSALEALRRLAGKDLVDYKYRKGYRLTEKGAKEAEALIRKHRVLETYLVRELGLPVEKACRKVREFDAFIPSDIVDKMCSKLGHPRCCPHGRPIPPGECHGGGGEDA